MGIYGKKDYELYREEGEKGGEERMNVHLLSSQHPIQLGNQQKQPNSQQNRKFKKKTFHLFYLPCFRLILMDDQHHQLIPLNSHPKINIPKKEF